MQILLWGIFNKDLHVSVPYMNITIFSVSLYKQLASQYAWGQKTSNKKIQNWNSLKANSFYITDIVDVPPSYALAF